MEREKVQEHLYTFPYHHLPDIENTYAWRIARGVWWGYQYCALLEQVLALIAKYMPSRVIDFGCGDGRLIKELSRQYDDIQIIGIDISERALAFARGFCFGNERVTFYQTIGDIPQSLLPVDAVVAMEVMEHIRPEALRAIVEQLKSLLRPDGILIVTVPTNNVPVNPKHYQHFSLEALKQYMGDGLTLVEHRYLHRTGLRWEIIRRMLFNRFFIANSETWLRCMTYVYKRFIMPADERSGAHLIAVFSKNLRT